LAKNVRVALLLPQVLDTEANRHAMPKADTSRWTPLDEISQWMYKILEGHSLVEKQTIKVTTRQGKTTFTSD